MGADIHGVWQARKDGGWVDVASTWDQDRHYLLFAWLAGVRNGFGFAGVKTHTPLRPIAEPRGLPADFQAPNEEHACSLEAINPRRMEYMDDEQKARPYVWMGDHSWSWLTADEILSAERPLGLTHTGVLTLAEFRKWDGVSAPEAYCGGVGGPGVLVSMPNRITPATTHVQVAWVSKDDGLDYFVDEVRRLKDLHGEVRLVFGFDS